MSWQLSLNGWTSINCHWISLKQNIWFFTWGKIDWIIPIIIEPLRILINQSLDKGFFPDKLKIAKVIPVFKKGNNSVFDKYRPISILNSFSKIYERVVFGQLYSYFVSNNLLMNSQYGFRACHSTEDAALEFVDYIFNQIEENHIPIAIFLDL